MKDYNIAVVGTTGAVGMEMVKILEERNFPIQKLFLFASKDSEGRKINFRNRNIIVHKLTKNSFENIDIVLFSGGGDISKKFVPIAIRSGAIAIDNSSVFRMNSHVPLIIPEVNPEQISKHRGVIANPNCSTIQLVVALKPIHDLVGIKRLVVSTYQSVSGTGKKAINELETQTGAKLNNKRIISKVYPHQIAFNIIPHIDVFEDNSYTKEEMKLFHETKKILQDEKIKISVTAARVPVLFGHAESVYLETRKHLEIADLKALYLKTSGIKLVDDIKNEKYPLPIMSETYDDVMVGRVRKDIEISNGINMWIVANNLRKGAALNAVQIAEVLIKNEL